MCALEGGVQGGGGLLISFVEGGYVGPEFKYQNPPAAATAVEPEAMARVRREKSVRQDMAGNVDGGMRCVGG